MQNIGTLLSLILIKQNCKKKKCNKNAKSIILWKKNWTKRDINKTELQKNVIKMLKVSYYEKKFEQSVILLKQNCKKM